jgi:hypothetical protein
VTLSHADEETGWREAVNDIDVSTTLERARKVQTPEQRTEKTPFRTCLPERESQRRLSGKWSNIVNW